MERQELSVFDVTRNEWNSLVTAFKKYDLEAGDDTELDNCWDARTTKDWREDEVLYWGRDGWRDGFYHAKLILRRATEDTCTIVLVRGDDPRSMLLTKALEYVEPFLKKHKGAA